MSHVDASAWQSNKIDGIIKDEHGIGLGNVTLRFGTAIASMSNREGSFSINVPLASADSLLISCVGYKTISISINSLKEGIIISMQPQVNQLEEVNISAITALDIVRKALGRISENYAVAPFEAIGFYRETAKLDSTYLSFAEAGMSILNLGYAQRKSQDKILVLQERNLQQVGEKAVNNPFGSALKGVPYIVLSNDIVKHPGAIFGSGFLKKYTYEITGETMIEGEEAYMISFDQKKEIREALYKGTVIITKDSYAFAAIDFSLSERGSAYAVPDIPLLQRPLLSLLGYHFQKRNEELSLRYYKIDKQWYPYFYSISTSHHVRARKQNIAGELAILAELFISKINKSPIRTYESAVMPTDYSFRKFVSQYTDDYWKNFDYIKPEQSLKQLVEQQSRM